MCWSCFCWMDGSVRLIVGLEQHCDFLSEVQALSAAEDEVVLRVLIYFFAFGGHLQFLWDIIMDLMRHLGGDQARGVEGY